MKIKFTYPDDVNAWYVDTKNKCYCLRDDSKYGELGHDFEAQLTTQEFRRMAYTIQQIYKYDVNWYGA